MTDDDDGGLPVEISPGLWEFDVGKERKKTAWECSQKRAEAVWWLLELYAAGHRAFTVTPPNLRELKLFILKLEELIRDDHPGILIKRLKRSALSQCTISCAGGQVATVALCLTEPEQREWVIRLETK